MVQQVRMEKLNARAAATLLDAQDATNIALMTAPFEVCCFAPLQAAGLVVQEKREHVSQLRGVGDSVQAHFEQAATLTLLEGAPVFRGIFYLHLGFEANGYVSAQLDYIAEEYTRKEPGSRVDMQVARASGKLDADGQSAWPLLHEALQADLQKRLAGKGESGKIFGQVLQHVTTTSLEWLER